MGDWAVMLEEGVRNSGQARVRVVLGETQRLLGQIRARGHGRPAEGAQEQDLQGGVGEQGADPRVAGRDGGREIRLGTPEEQDDRRHRGGEQRLGPRRKHGGGADQPRSGNITAKGFSSRCLRRRRAATAVSSPASTIRW